MACLRVRPPAVADSRSEHSAARQPGPSGAAQTLRAVAPCVTEEVCRGYTVWDHWIKREDSGLLRAFGLLTGTVAPDRETASHIYSTMESAFGHKVTLSTTSWCPLWEPVAQHSPGWQEAWLLLLVPHRQTLCQFKSSWPPAPRWSPASGGASPSLLRLQPEPPSEHAHPCPAALPLPPSAPASLLPTSCCSHPGQPCPSVSLLRLSPPSQGCPPGPHTHACLCFIERNVISGSQAS